MEVYIKHIATEDLPFWDSYCVLGNGPRLVCPNPPPPLIHVQPLNVIKKSHPRRLHRKINKDSPEKDFADEPKSIKTPSEIVVEEVIEGVVIVKKFIEIEVKHFSTEDSSFDSVSPSSANGHTDTDSDYDLTEEENKELINEMKYRLEELLGIPNEPRSKVLTSDEPLSTVELDTLPVFTESSVSNGNLSVAVESLSDDVFEADSDMLASNKDMSMQNHHFKQNDASDAEDVNNARKFSLTSAKSIDSNVTNQTVSSEGSSFALWALFGSENSLDRIEHFISLTKSDSFDYKNGKTRSLDVEHDSDPYVEYGTQSNGGNKSLIENDGKGTDTSYNQAKNSDYSCISTCGQSFTDETNDAGTNFNNRLNVDNLGITNEDSDDSISVSVDLEICVRVSLNEDATVQSPVMGSPVDDFGNGSTTSTVVTDPCVLIAREIVEKVLEASRPLVALSTDRALKDRREKPNPDCTVDGTDVHNGAESRRCTGACNELEHKEADIDIDESQSEGFFEQSADWDGQSDVYVIHNDISSHASMERIPDEESPHDICEKLNEVSNESCKNSMNDMYALSKSKDSVVDFEKFQNDLFDQTEMTSEGILLHSSNVNIYDSSFRGDCNEAHLDDAIEETDTNSQQFQYDGLDMCGAVCTNNLGISVLSTVMEESEVNSTVDSTIVKCEYSDDNGDGHTVECSGTSPGLSVKVRHQTFKYDDDVEVLAVMINRDCDGKSDTNECSMDEVEKILNDLIEDISMNVGEGSEDPSAMAIIIDDQNGFDNPAVEYIELQDPDDCNVNELLNDMLEKVTHDLSSDTDSNDNTSHPVALIIDEVSFQEGSSNQLGRISDVRPRDDTDIVIVAKQNSEESDIGFDDSRCLDSSEDYITCVSSEEDYNYPATGNEHNIDTQDSQEKTDDTNRNCMETSLNRKSISESNEILENTGYDLITADNDSEILMTDNDKDTDLNNKCHEKNMDLTVINSDIGCVDVEREGTKSIVCNEYKLRNETENQNDDLPLSSSSFHEDQSFLSGKREVNVTSCLQKPHLSEVFGQLECPTEGNSIVTTEDPGECIISDSKVYENEIEEFTSGQEDEVTCDNDLFGEKGDEISGNGHVEEADIEVSTKRFNKFQENAIDDVTSLVSVDETVNMTLISDQCHGHSEIQENNMDEDVLELPDGQTAQINHSEYDKMHALSVDHYEKNSAFSNQLPDFEGSSPKHKNIATEDPCCIVNTINVVPDHETLKPNEYDEIQTRDEKNDAQEKECEEPQEERVSCPHDRNICKKDVNEEIKTESIEECLNGTEENPTEMEEESVEIIKKGSTNKEVTEHGVPLKGDLRIVQNRNSKNEGQKIELIDISKFDATSNVSEHNYSVDDIKSNAFEIVENVEENVTLKTDNTENDARVTEYEESAINEICVKIVDMENNDTNVNTDDVECFDLKAGVDMHGHHDMNIKGDDFRNNDKNVQVEGNEIMMKEMNDDDTDITIEEIANSVTNMNTDVIEKNDAHIRINGNVNDHEIRMNDADAEVDDIKHNNAFVKADEIENKSSYVKDDKTSNNDTRVKNDEIVNSDTDGKIYVIEKNDAKIEDNYVNDNFFEKENNEIESKDTNVNDNIVTGGTAVIIGECENCSVDGNVDKFVNVDETITVDINKNNDENVNADESLINDSNIKVAVIEKEYFEVKVDEICSNDKNVELDEIENSNACIDARNRNTDVRDCEIDNDGTDVKICRFEDNSLNGKVNKMKDNDENINVEEIVDNNTGGKLAESGGNNTEAKVDEIVINDTNVKDADFFYDDAYVKVNEIESNGTDIKNDGFDYDDPQDKLYEIDTGGNVDKIVNNDVNIKSDEIDNSVREVKDDEINYGCTNINIDAIEINDADTKVDEIEKTNKDGKCYGIWNNDTCVKADENVNFGLEADELGNNDADVNFDEIEKSDTNVRVDKQYLKGVIIDEEYVNVDEIEKNDATIEDDVNLNKTTNVKKYEILSADECGIDNNVTNFKSDETKINYTDINFDDIANDTDIRINEIVNESTDVKYEVIVKNDAGSKNAGNIKSDDVECYDADINIDEMEGNNLIEKNKEIPKNDAHIKVDVNENDSTKIKVDGIEGNIENENIDEIVDSDANIKVDVHEIDDMEKVDIEKNDNLKERNHDFTPEFAGSEVAKYKKNSESSNNKMIDSTFIFSGQKLIIVISEEITALDESNRETKISVKEDGGWYFVKTVHDEGQGEVFHEKDNKNNNQQSEIHQTETNVTEALFVNDEACECGSIIHQGVDSIDALNAASVEQDVDKKLGILPGKELLVVQETPKVHNSYEKFNLAATDIHKQEITSDVSIKVKNEIGSSRENISNIGESVRVSDKIADINTEHDIAKDNLSLHVENWKMMSDNECVNNYGTQNENTGSMIYDDEESLKKIHGVDKNDSITNSFIADKVPVNDAVSEEKDEVNTFMKKSESDMLPNTKCSSDVISKDDLPSDNCIINDSVQMDHNNIDVQMINNKNQNAVSINVEYLNQIPEREAENVEIYDDIKNDSDKLLTENLCDQNGDKVLNEFGNTINLVDDIQTVLNVDENLIGNDESIGKFAMSENILELDKKSKYAENFVDESNDDDIVSFAENIGIQSESNIDMYVQQTENDDSQINEKTNLPADINQGLPIDSSDKNLEATELRDFATKNNASCENANSEVLDNERKDISILDETRQLEKDFEDNERSLKTDNDECCVGFKEDSFENKCEEMFDDISDAAKSDKIDVVVSRRRSYDKNKILEQSFVAFCEISAEQNEDGIIDVPLDNTQISDDNVNINLKENDSIHTDENVKKLQNEISYDVQETDVGNIKPDDQTKHERQVYGLDVEENIATEESSGLLPAEKHLQTCDNSVRSNDRVFNDEVASNETVNTMPTVKNRADDLETDTISEITVWNSSKSCLSRPNTNKLRRGKSFIRNDDNVKFTGLQRKPSLSQIKVYKAVEMNSEDDALLPESQPGLVEEDTMDASMKNCVTPGEAIVGGMHSMLDEGTYSFDETQHLKELPETETLHLKELPETNSKVLLPQNAIDQGINGEATSGINSEDSPAEEPVNDQCELDAQIATDGKNRGINDDCPEGCLVDEQVDPATTDIVYMDSTNVEDKVDLSQTMGRNMKPGYAEDKDNLSPTDKVNLTLEEDVDVIKSRSQVYSQGNSENTEEGNHYCEKNTKGCVLLDKKESYFDSESFMVSVNGISSSEFQEKIPILFEKDDITAAKNETQNPIAENNVPSSNQNLDFEVVAHADNDFADDVQEIHKTPCEAKHRITFSDHDDAECFNEKPSQNIQESVQDTDNNIAINSSGFGPTDAANANEEAKENIYEQNFGERYKIINNVDSVPLTGQETTMKDDMSDLPCVEITSIKVAKDVLSDEIGQGLVENENEIKNDFYKENDFVQVNTSGISDETNVNESILVQAMETEHLKTLKTESDEHNSLMEDSCQNSHLNMFESSAKLDGGTIEVDDKSCDAIYTGKNNIEADKTEETQTQNDNESNIILPVQTDSKDEPEIEHGNEQMSMGYPGEVYQAVDAMDTDTNPENSAVTVCENISENILSDKNSAFEPNFHGTEDSQCDNEIDKVRTSCSSANCRNEDAIDAIVDHSIEQDVNVNEINNVEVAHDTNKMKEVETELRVSLMRDNSQDTPTDAALGTDLEVKYNVNEMNFTADNTPDEIRYYDEQPDNELKEMESTHIVPYNENMDSVHKQYNNTDKGKEIEINETSLDHKTDDEPMAKNTCDERDVLSTAVNEISNCCKEEDVVDNMTSIEKEQFETNNYQDVSNQDASETSKLACIEVNIEQSAEKPHDDNAFINKATDASNRSPSVNEHPTESTEVTNNSVNEPNDLQRSAESPDNADYAEIKSSPEHESDDITHPKNFTNTGCIEHKSNAEQVLNDIAPHERLTNAYCTETKKDTENVSKDLPSDKSPDNMKCNEIKINADQTSISLENEECSETDNAECVSVELQPFIECPGKSEIINITEHVLNDKIECHGIVAIAETKCDEIKECTDHLTDDLSPSEESPANKECDEVAPNDLPLVDVSNAEYDSIISNDIIPKEDPDNTEKECSAINNITEPALNNIPPANENPADTKTDCSVRNNFYEHASNDILSTEESPFRTECTEFTNNTNQTSTEVPLAEDSASTGAEFSETQNICDGKDEITAKNMNHFNEREESITVPPDIDKIPEDVNITNTSDGSYNLTNTQSIIQRDVTHELPVEVNGVNNIKSNPVAESQTYHRNTFEVVADVHCSMDMDEQRPYVAKTKHSTGKVNDVVAMDGGRNSNLIESRHKSRDSEINIVGLDHERGINHAPKSSDYHVSPEEKTNELHKNKPEGKSHSSAIISSINDKEAIEDCMDDIEQSIEVTDLPSDKVNPNHDENQTQKSLSHKSSIQQDLRSRSLSDVFTKARVPPDGTEGTHGMKNRTSSLGNLTKYKTLTEFECRKQFFESRGRVSGESQDHSAEHFREKGRNAIDLNADIEARQEEDRKDYQGFQSDNYRRSIDHAHIKDMNEMTAVDIDLNENEYDDDIGCVDADVLSNRLKKWLADRRRSSLQGETERFIKEAFPDDICPTPRRLHRLCEHIKMEAKKRDLFIKQRNESLDSSGQVRDLTLRRYGSGQRSMECLDRDVAMARRSREGSRRPSIERRSSRGSISPLESPHNSPYQSLEDLRYKCRKPDFIEVRKLNNERRKKKADFLMNAHLKTFAKPKPVVNENHGPFELVKVRTGLSRDENFDRQYASAKRRGLYPQVKVADQARQIEYEVYRYDREFRQNENQNIRAYVESQYLNTNQIYHQGKSSKHGNLRERYDGTQITNKHGRIIDTTTTALYEQPITDQYQKNRCANKQAPTLTTKVVTLSSNQDNGLQLYRSNLEQVHDRNKLPQHLLGHRDPTGPNGPKGLQKMRIPLDREKTPKDGPLSLADSFTAMDRSQSHDSQSTVGSHSYSNAGSHSNTGSHHSHTGSHSIKHAIASKLDSHDSSSPNLSHASKLSGNHILSGNNLSAHHMSGNSLSQELASKLDIADSSTHSLAGQINNRLSTHRSSSSGHNMSGQNLSQELASKLDIADSSTHSLAGQINNRLSANNMSGQNLSQELASKLDIADSSGHSLDRLQNLSTHSVGKESLSHELAAKLDIHSSSQNLSGKLSDSQTSLSSRQAPSRSPSRQNTLQKQHSVQSSMSEINGERKESYVGGIKFERLKNLEEDELLAKIREIIGHLERLEDYHRGDGMRIQKMLGDMYWDYTHMREMIADCMAENGYAVVAMKMLKTLNSIGIFKNDDVWFPTYYTYNTMWNFSDASPILAKKLSENDAVRLLTLNCGHKPYINALHSKNVFYVIKASLSILHNIARNSGMKHLFDENKTSETIMPFIESEDEMLKILASLTIANIVDEEENKTIIVETRTIHNIVGWIDKAINLPRRRYKGFTPQELTEGLNKLAVNDSNKMKIVDEGGIPLFLKMLQNEDVREQSSAGRIIWTLSFDKDVRETFIANTDLISTLEKLVESTNKSVQQNASGSLWIIKGENDISRETRPKPPATKSHVFLSYSWSDKEEVLELRDKLRAEGYAIWIDIEKDSTLDGMAHAVEHSAVVLVCMSEKYKHNPNCRTEAEYTFQMKKEYIPLMMQKKYRPDGWLGVILGAKLYFDFSGKYPFEKSFTGLLKELRGRGKVTPNNTPNGNDVSEGGMQSHMLALTGGSFQSPGTAVPCNSIIMNMGQEELIKWLRNVKLTECIPAFLEFDGRLLMQLKQMRVEAPEFFYQCLEKRLNMSLIEILKFTRALEELH